MAQRGCNWDCFQSGLPRHLPIIEEGLRKCYTIRVELNWACLPIATKPAQSTLINQFFWDFSRYTFWMKALALEKCLEISYQNYWWRDSQRVQGKMASDKTSLYQNHPSTLSHSNLQTVLYFPWSKKRSSACVCAHVHVWLRVISGAIPDTTLIYYRNVRVEIEEDSQIPIKVPKW